ncbi:MAG: InlB B-repeat-containing protein, partial [Clostridia bacterium]|nr:InlB B-repeat-containing protein [Clostridia bacterium]
MKIRNAYLAVVLVIVLMTASACSLYDDSNSVQLNLNGGTVESKLTAYTPGEEVELPEPTREHYTFEGWYTNANFEGEAVEKIPSTATGKQTYWAKWIPDVYTVTLNSNGGTVAGSLTEYTYGVGATLPSATKNGYNFIGWTDGQNQTVTEISETDFGNKEFWAQWSGATYNLTLNLNGGSLSNAPTSYIYGNETPLPEPTMSGFDFWGWYENSNFSGNAVEKISATDEPGDRVFYAKWEPEAEINVTAWGGYDEGAYLKFELLDNVASSAYKVEYSVAGQNSYTQIDSELIRCDTSSGTGRADVVGISAGKYDIKLSAGSKTVVKTDIQVSACDRSGYAHFDAGASDKTYAAGVGGYTNTGVPKSNAQIIYVSEATKNTVMATIGGKSYTGLVAILRALPSAKTPVIIRILDTIKAATWNAINYGQDTVTADYVIANTPSTKSNTLEKKKYSMQELIDGGFNTLNTDPAKGGCSVLEGLYDRDGNTYYGGYMNYDDGKKEFDSCWNNCTIGTSSSAGKFAKNVTVEGIGTNAGLFQWGITWKYAESVEVRNLTFDDYNEDACSFEGNTNSTTFDGFDSNRIWLHHCTFEQGKNYWDVCNEQDKNDG